MLRKFVIIGIIVVLLIAGAFYFGVTEVWEDGAPPAQVTVRLTDPSSGNEWEGTVNVNEGTIGTLTGSRTSLQPATITAELIGVEPGADYELEFIVDFQAELAPDAPPGLELFGDVSIRGHHDAPARFFYNSAIYGTPTDNTQIYPNEIEDIPLAANQTGRASFIKTSNLHFDEMRNTVPNTNTKIPGQYIDNSIWPITITTGTAYAGTDAYWGQTTVVLTLVVDTSGNINILVTDVGVTASEV